MPKLKAPQDHGSVSVEGVEYLADGNGFVTVPDEAVKHLIDHGFYQIDDLVENEKLADKSKKFKPKE